jgi:hypothetical protein
MIAPTTGEPSVVTTVPDTTEVTCAVTAWAKKGNAQIATMLGSSVVKDV